MALVVQRSSDDQVHPFVLAPSLFLIAAMRAQVPGAPMSISTLPRSPQPSMYSQGGGYYGQAQPGIYQQQQYQQQPYDEQSQYGPNYGSDAGSQQAAAAAAAAGGHYGQGLPVYGGAGGTGGGLTGESVHSGAAAPMEPYGPRQLSGGSLVPPQQLFHAQQQQQQQQQHPGEAVPPAPPAVPVGPAARLVRLLIFVSHTCRVCVSSDPLASRLSPLLFSPSVASLRLRSSFSSRCAAAEGLHRAAPGWREAMASGLWSNMRRC
jgi:hypothetical protein